MIKTERLSNYVCVPLPVGASKSNIRARSTLIDRSENEIKSLIRQGYKVNKLINSSYIEYDYCYIID